MKKKILIVSATLLGVETLKYPPFHGFVFLPRSLVNLVTFLVSENGLSSKVVRYCFVHLYDIKSIKTTFLSQKFIVITIFALKNSFICFF